MPNKPQRVGTARKRYLPAEPVPGHAAVNGRQAAEEQRQVDEELRQTAESYACAQVARDRVAL
jgi:hypothetical protein